MQIGLGLVSLRTKSGCSAATTAALLFLLGCSARVAPPEELPLAYRQAEDAFRLGDYDRAVSGYQIFLRRGDREDLVPRAFYRLALAELRRGRPQNCIAVLDQMEQRYPGREWSQAYELRGDAEEARRNIISAVRWWEFAWVAADKDGKQRLQVRMNEALAGMDRSTLVSVRSVLSTPQIQGLVDARLRQSAGDTTPLRPANAKRPTPQAAPGSYAVAEGEEPTPRIACLLSLSGPYAIYGQRSLNGIRLALGADAAQLLVRDSKGKVQVARAALDELIAEPGVVAVIGPLRSKIAQAIAPRAERAGLPLIVLSQREGVSGRYVLQPAMTYERQAATLAEYAVGERALNRFGILYPRDGYGTALAEAFREEIQRRRGRIVGTVAYTPGAREFSVELLSVQKWIDHDALQAVFLPDFAATAVTLGSELHRAYPDLTLFGSNGWNDPLQLSRVASDLDGAVFVDGFFAGSRRPATQEFVSTYQQAYRVVPEILEAQAYDAATLVRKALETGARARVQVIPALQALRRMAGAAGNIDIGPNGLERELFLLRLFAGTITEISPELSRNTATDRGDFTASTFQW